MAMSDDQPAACNPARMRAMQPQIRGARPTISSRACNPARARVTPLQIRRTVYRGFVRLTAGRMLSREGDSHAAADQGGIEVTM